MEDHTKRSRFWRVIPFVAILLVMLVSGGIALAGVPAAVPAGAGAAAPAQQQAKQAQQEGSIALSNAGLPSTGSVGKSVDSTDSPQVFVNKAVEPVATDRHA